MAFALRKASSWGDLFAGLLVGVVCIASVVFATTSMAFVSGADGTIVGRHTRRGKGTSYHLAVATAAGVREVTVPRDAYDGCREAFHREPFALSVQCDGRSYTHISVVFTVLLGAVFGVFAFAMAREAAQSIYARRAGRKAR